MGQYASCEYIRTFHSRQNWLGKGNIYRIQRPYTDISSGFACLLPITCFIVLVSFVVYNATDPAREDSDHIVYMKDAEPHWRLSEKQYRHFYQPLQFAFDSSQFSASTNFTASVHQQYDLLRDDQRVWSCTDYIAKNNFNATLSADNEYKNNEATLCYYKRHSSFANSDGLFLCRETNTETVFFRIQTPRYNYDSNDFDSDVYDDVIVQQWDPNESLIITLQLWVLYDWSDQEGDPMAVEPVWRHNVLEIVSVERYPGQQFAPPGELCYGVKVMMSRQVYVIEDGTAGWNTVIVTLSLFGGAWSFILLVHAGCAACWDNILWYASKKRRKRIMEFAVKFQGMEDERFKEYLGHPLEDNLSTTINESEMKAATQATSEVELAEQEQEEE